MARAKQTPEERKRRKAERNKRYWESHKAEIAEKRKKSVLRIKPNKKPGKSSTKSK